MAFQDLAVLKQMNKNPSLVDLFFKAVSIRLESRIEIMEKETTVRFSSAMLMNFCAFTSHNNDITVQHVRLLVSIAMKVSTCTSPCCIQKAIKNC